MNEEEAEREAEKIMQEIDQSPAAGSDVPRSAAIAYYDAIIDHCKTARDCIQDEMELRDEASDSEDEEEAAGEGQD